MTAIDRSSSETDRPAALGCAVLVAVQRRFHRSGYTALSRLRYEFQRESGVLHLRGAVRSYYLKQLAQELVVDLEGVRVVNNQINVARPARCGTARDGGCPDDADASSGT